MLLMKLIYNHYIIFFYKIDTQRDFLGQVHLNTKHRFPFVNKTLFFIFNFLLKNKKCIMVMQLPLEIIEMVVNYVNCPSTLINLVFASKSTKKAVDYILDFDDLNTDFIPRNNLLSQKLGCCAKCLKFPLKKDPFFNKSYYLCNKCSGDIEKISLLNCNKFYGLEERDLYFIPYIMVKSKYTRYTYYKQYLLSDVRKVTQRKKKTVEEYFRLKKIF